MRNIPPEERKNEDENQKFELKATFLDEIPEQDAFHQMISEGNIAVFYSKQPENCPEEEGVPSNAELDKMNEELARRFFPLFTHVRQSLLSSDWSQPMDVVIMNEEKFWYFACAYPSVVLNIDWNLASQIIQDLAQDAIAYVQQMDIPNVSEEDKAKLSQIDLQSFLQVETEGISKTTTGLTCYKVKISATPPEESPVVIHTLCAQESGTFYAVVYAGDGDSEEQYETMQQRLEQKINASKQAAAEKLKPPTTVVRSNLEGVKFCINYEQTEHRTCITAYLAQDSCDNIINLGQAFGITPANLFP
jgi:hypothetical protein